MAFDIYYNPPASAVAALAKQGGTGQYNLRMQERADAENARRRAERMQRQKIVSDQQMFERQEKAKLDRFQLEQQAEFDRDKRYQEFLLQRDEKKAEQQGNLVELKYTAKQRADLEKLNQDEDYVNQSDSMSPMQKQQALAEINKKRSAIKKLPLPQQDSPFPQGQDIGQTWETPGGGLATRDNKGNVRLLVKPPSVEEYSKIYDSVVKSLTNEDTGAAPDPAKVEEAVAAKLAAYRKFMSEQNAMDQQAAQGQQPGPAQAAEQTPQAQAPQAPPAERAKQMLSFVDEKKKQIVTGMRDLRGSGRSKMAQEESKKLALVSTALTNMRKELMDISEGKSQKTIEEVMTKFQQESKGEKARTPITEPSTQAPAATAQAQPQEAAQKPPADERITKIDERIAEIKKVHDQNKRIKEGETTKVDKAKQETAKAALEIRLLEAKKQLLKSGGDPKAYGKYVKEVYNSSIKGQLSPELQQQLERIKKKYEIINSASK